MKAIKTLFTAGLFAVSSAALAVPVDLTVVNAEWSSWTGGKNTSAYDSDGNGSKDTLVWGDKTVKSGYRFTDAGNLPAQFEAGETFVLGTFTHFNREISQGSAITAANLSISTELDILGSNITDGPYTFTFTHNETPNVGKECFLFWCWDVEKMVDDVITFDTTVLSNEFNVGNHYFTLEILGFEGYGQSGTLHTPEGKTTSANVLARLNVRTVPVPQVVSEPATLALMGLGMLGLGMMRRRSA